MSRTRFIRNIFASLAALACLCSGIIVFGAARHEAQAATQKSAYATATMNKVSDGTGHGTDNQTFVNAQNGFEPGDNTPNDGIVASGDFVVNNLSLRFTAAGARSVRVRWDLSKAPWLMGDTSFCYDGAQVKAEAQPDGSCVFTIGTGAVETMDRTLFLVGKDTVGTVRPDNQATLIVERVAKNNQGEWVNDGQSFERFEQKTAPVTVVSAPAADLTIQDYGLTGSERRPQWSAGQDLSGYFDVTINPLGYPGWSSHGASTKGEWWGKANVSEFPPDTVWSIVPIDDEGNEITDKAQQIGEADANGQIDLPKISGNARLKWTISKDHYQDYANKEDPSDSKSYAWKIQLLPDKEAFSAADTGDGATRMLNMGTGGEPGLGEKETYNTANPETSALKGYPFANNDWSQALVTVLGNGKSPGAKMLFRPYTSGKTAFEDENRFFDQAAGEVSTLEKIGETDVVAQGTQVRTVLSADPSKPEANRPILGTPFTMQDMWARNEQIYDGALTIKQGQTVIDPSKYTVYYTTDAKPNADKQCDTSFTEPQWVEGTPNVGDMSVRGIRVVFNNADGDLQWGDGAPLITVSFVAKANQPNNSGSSEGDGTISDRYRLGWTQPDPDSEDKQKAMARCMAQSIWVTKPRPISAEISMGLKIKAPDGTERTGTGAPGDTVTYNVIATPKEGATKESLQKPDNQYLSVKSVMLAGTSMLPTLRIPLPDGLVDPVSSSSFWKMEVRQEKNEKGKLQDVMYFTPAQGKITPEVSSAGTAKFEPLLWSARVSNTASGYIGATASMTVNTDAQDAVTAQTASAAATAETFAVSDDWRQGAVLNPVTPVVEITEDVAFKFNLAASGTGRSGTMTTVLRMPNSGADVPTAGDNAGEDDRAMRGEGCNPSDSQTAEGCKGLDGQWNEYPGDYSSYQGGTVMTKPVELATKESTNTEVLYAVDNVYSEDPKDFTWLTWDELTAKYGSAPRVTALKLTTDFEKTDPDHPDYQVASSVGKVYVSIDKDKPNHSGDKYVMWLGKARYSQELPADKPAPTVPFPAQAEIVASTIEGTLWWDQDRSTSINKDSQGNPTEELISGVKVSLYKLNSDGSKASDTPIATQLTDAQGHYKFTELHSGNYAVEVTRNECSDNAQTSCEVTGTTALPGVQTKSRTYYNQQLDVDITRSWKAVGDATSDSSGMIELPVSIAQKKVDFGYVKPDPKVTLNKTQQSLNCDDAKCVVNWDVVVENKGTEPIPAGTESVLNDRMSSLVQHVSATVGVETEDTNKKVNFTQVDSGYDHTLALDEEGHVWGAGDNSQYELGDGTTVGITTPKRLIIDPTNPDLKFKQIAAGENHSFAIDEYGRLWGWGDNKSWRITGAPLEFNSKQTTQRQSDNSLIRWGDPGSINTPNDGSLAFLETPQLIQFTQNGQPVSDTNPAIDMKWRYITSKYNSTIAIDDQGHMWSWGSNWGDALGRGVSTSVLMGIGKVINVPDDEKFTTVHSGDAHSIALTEDGHVWNFGFNDYGQLGREAVSLSGGGSNVPAQVQGVIAKDIAAGERAEYYIDTSGNVYSTGANGFGQLGLGYKDSSDETIGSRKKQFYKVDGVTADSIYASDANAVVITPSGDVYGWGSNLRGQLGTGATDPQLTPVKIFDKEYQITALSVSSALSRSHWALGGKVTASEGVTTIAAVTADGNGVGLGNNASGQLANGKKTDKQTTPIIMKGYVQPTTPPVDPTAQPTTPTSEATVGTEVTRTYTVPFTVNPGGRVVWHMQGTVMRTTAVQTAHNQAWFSSTLTPYATAPDTAAGRSQWEGVPSARGAQVTLPNVLNDANLNETMRDITGNTVTGKDGKTYNVCLTGTDVNSVDKEHSFATNAEDSCDQVGLKINPYSTKPILGKISGVMWRDNDKNGVRDDGEPMIAGQKVYLLDQDGNEMPGYVTTTDANGHYEFTNLEVGTADQPKRYSVRFEPVYRSEFTKEDVNDSDPALDTSADRDSDASTNPDTYGYATVYASLTDTHTEQDHLDAGVTPEKTWLAAMPHTGFGLWALVIVSVLLLAVMNMLALLLRKEH